MIIGSKAESPIERGSSPFHMLRWVLNFWYIRNGTEQRWNFRLNYNHRKIICVVFYLRQLKVLTDIGSNAPAVPSKPVGAPAAHSLIASPNYQLSPRSNFATDVTTTTNIISNGNHSPVVRETTKTKTEVLHVDTNSEPVPWVSFEFSFCESEKNGDIRNCNQCV